MDARLAARDAVRHRRRARLRQRSAEHARALRRARAGFRAGSTIAEFPNIDVYDLLARLLGINPAPNDGTLAPFQPVLR